MRDSGKNCREKASLSRKNKVMAVLMIYTEVHQPNNFERSYMFFFSVLPADTKMKF